MTMEGVKPAVRARCGLDSSHRRDYVVFLVLLHARCSDVWEIQDVRQRHFVINEGCTLCQRVESMNEPSLAKS